MVRAFGMGNVSPESAGPERLRRREAFPQRLTPLDQYLPCATQWLLQFVVRMSMA
jgi:hypothetical protein